GYNAAAEFACDVPLLRPAKEQENRNSSSFLFPLDPRRLGRYDGCVPGSTVGTEAPAALRRSVACSRSALSFGYSHSYSSIAASVTLLQKTFASGSPTNDDL